MCRLNLRLGFGICQPGSRQLRLTQCLSEDCVKIAARYLMNMNRNVRPCDDFYGFVCGNYENHIPEGRSRFEVLGQTWEVLAAQISSYGIHPMLEVYVESDFDNSEIMILKFSPAGHFQNSYDFKTRIFEISKIFPEHLNISEPEIQEICDFLDRIVNLTSVNQESNQMINKLTYGDLKNRYKNIDFTKFVNPIKIDNSTVVNIDDPKFFKNFDNFIKNVSAEVIQNYQIFWFLHKLWEHFESKFDCFEETREKFRMILGAEFVRKYLPKKNKDEVQKMVFEFKSEMKSIISTAKWLDVSTRNEALKKLEKINTFVGHPDFLLNETRILEPYQHLNSKLDPQNYIKNLINYKISQRSYSFSENELKKRGVEATLEWPTVILESDAFNYYAGNAIIFPAGIIQFPFFVPNSPSFINYGSLGFGIGHEISHGYDNRGAKFDGFGREIMWWGNETYDKFNEGKTCFQEQYRNAVMKIMSNFNSEFKYEAGVTIQEDIADNGGVRIAFEAYKKHLRNERRKTSGIRNVLPGLTQFTDEQMFFIALGNSVCESYNPLKLSEIINNSSDPHSLSQFRLNIPLQNYPEFSRVWGCSTQEKMCRIW
ncbi:unnamed protein product [Caenorhabditis angaria]|uniref:Peptidase M13 C-terminal domain-containing protein n=1 Tax=Caenorhabditis angaria TaxID=860376 RepID=A0A9P1IEL6_9PELO|nr:unnamed protein product [Caenorhabditis angaria]